MADFNNPVSGQAYLALLTSIVENNDAAVQMLEGVATLANLPNKAKRWNPTNKRFEFWNGTVWAELTTLFEMKVRNSDQLNGKNEASYRNAGLLASGILPSNRFNNSSHANRGGGSLHALATTVLNGFMSSNDKSKLDAIEAGAKGDLAGSEILALLLNVDGTGSGLDADFLDGWHRDSIRARGNHTGTQPMSTISNAGSLATLNQVSQVQIISASIGQTQLKTAVASSSVLIPSQSTRSLILSGGNHSWWTISAQTNNNGQIGLGGGNLGPGIIGLNNSGSFSQLTAYVDERYIQASPPYDLGDGEIQLFVTVMVDSVGKIMAYNVAPDPIWAYNGPTNVCADFYNDAKAYQKKLILPHSARAALNDPAMLAENKIARLDSSNVVNVEVTQAIKHADKEVIPYCWESIPDDCSVVMLDPVSPIIDELRDLHDSGEKIGQLLHDGYLTFDNSPLVRGMPSKVLTVKPIWKNIG